ncbi:response regulator [Mucilaginibacter myungsuensis]|uniref:Response regulator n=1 Tax=Mucilaginibacter myungsuensis TaxID=649104 RepID=A0A929PWV6_9SPHI|nr:response regulator [Mucilaginibacter myungsuensis]MBE9661745.1 response regulator [Mucilaginibacter myungsuensis]MDN3599823.1 response regulator [Mucilaginibacter myungsuensis]
MIGTTDIYNTISQFYTTHLQPTNKRILVLDDNQDILEMVNEVLVYEDFEVHATTDSNDILGVAEEFDPHLVILDYRLNNANGGEICRQLKNTDQFKDTPVIIFSAYLNFAVDYDKYGCDAVLPKPFDLAQLIDTVNGLIVKF